jgi:hypothetical protein
MSAEAKPLVDPTPEAIFKRRLFELGLLTELKPPPVPPAAVRPYRTPIALEGRPGSKLILEERR